MKPYSKEVKIYNGKTITANVNSYPVDPDKFKKIFIDKRIIVADVSRSLGYAANTISSALHTGIFSGPVIAGLRNQYGVDYSEYEYKPEEQKEPETEKEPEKETVCADETALYRTMKLAMLDAINEALAANMKNLRGMIYTAISQAKQ